MKVNLLFTNAFSLSATNINNHIIRDSVLVNKTFFPLKLKKCEIKITKSGKKMVLENIKKWYSKCTVIQYRKYSINFRTSCTSSENFMIQQRNKYIKVSIFFTFGWFSSKHESIRLSKSKRVLTYEILECSQLNWTTHIYQCRFRFRFNAFFYSHYLFIYIYIKKRSNWKIIWDYITKQGFVFERGNVKDRINFLISKLKL